MSKVTRSSFPKLEPKEKEAYLVRFVSTMWDSALKQTLEDRSRWRVSYDLFRGKQDWGEVRNRDKWRAKVFNHQFSVLVRRASETAQDLIFERPDFFTFEANDPRDAEFARIREKLSRHYTDELDVENFSYEYFLTGGIFGIAIWKLFIEPKLYPDPEVLVAKLKKQREQEEKGMKGFITNDPLGLPEDASGVETGIEAVLREMGMPKSVKQGRPQKKAEEMYEMCFKLQNINPFNWVYEPDTCPITATPYTCERNFVKKFQLEPLFKSGFLDKSKQQYLRNLDSLSLSGGSSVMDTYEEQKWVLRQQTDDANQFVPKVELLEYYGPLLSETGDVIEENRHIIIANRKHLLRNKQIAKWDQKHPYGVSVFSKVPFKPVGQGIADNAVDQQLISNELLSLFVDLMNFAVLGVNVVDDTGLDEPEQIDGGFYPGQVLHANKKATDIIDSFPVNFAVAPHLFQTLEFLRLNGQIGSGVDTTSSNPSSRARITGTEIQSNENRTMQSIFALGRELDSSFIEPLVCALDAYAMQFGLDDSNLALLNFKGVITDAEFQLIANIPEVERANEVRRKGVKVKIRGFRERLERNDFLARVGELLQQLNAMPEARGSISFKDLLARVLQAYNMPVDEIIISNNPADKAREENVLLERGQTVTILPNDEHGIEIGEHYQGAVRNPSPQLVAHIQAHAQAIQMQGGQPPPPPPEIAQLLGMQSNPPPSELH